MKIHDSENGRIETAIRDLRSEEVPPGSKDRVFDAMLRPSRNEKPTQVVGVLSAVAVVLAIFLWPERKAMAWSKVVQATLSTERLHHSDFERTTKDGDWKKVSDEWIDGTKSAFIAHIPSHTDGPDITIDMRYDGKRAYRLDWTGYGIVFNDKPRTRFLNGSGRFSLQELLKDPRIKVEKSPTEATVDGVKVLRYQAKAFEGPVKSGFSSPMAFYVEKEGGRVIRTEVFGLNGALDEYSTVDYPTEIPEDVFLPPTKGVRVFDFNRDAESLRRTMEKGVPIGQGNVLRAAIQSPSGEVVILWTGTPPNGDGSQRPIILSHPDHGIFAPDQITASRWKLNGKGLYKFDGQPLCGLALQVNKPVSGKVTVQVPILIPNKSQPIRNSMGIIKGYGSKQVGTATVRDFPVIQTMPFAVLGFLNRSLEW